MRDIIHKDIWVNALFVDYRSENGEIVANGNSSTHNKANWIITDMRFPNEMKAIEDRAGITIRINRKSHERFCKNCNKGFYMKDVIHKGLIATGLQIRGEVFCPNCDSIKTFSAMAEPSIHPSETALDNSKFKYTIDNDGSIEELVEKVREILILEKII